MMIQFLTDDVSTFEGFKAYFHYMPIEPNCENWLNRSTQCLKSPDYPIIDCSWVITAPSTDSTIIINFETFEVEYFFSIFNFSISEATCQFLCPFFNLLKFWTT